MRRALATRSLGRNPLAPGGPRWAIELVELLAGRLLGDDVGPATTWTIRACLIAARSRDEGASRFHEAAAGLHVHDDLDV